MTVRAGTRHSRTMGSPGHDDGSDPAPSSPRLASVLARLEADPEFVAALFSDPWTVVAGSRLDAADVETLVIVLRQKSAAAARDAATRRRAGAALFGLLAKLRHPSSKNLTEDPK